MDADQLRAYIQGLTAGAGAITQRRTALPTNMPTFSGKTTENVDTWLFHFNTQVEIAHVPDGDKIGVASGLCSGYALQTLRSYVTREGDRATWTGLSELFKTTFRPVGHEKLL